MNALLTMTASPPKGATSLTGTTVGRFVIGPLLGKGGMGEVYRAEDTGLKRPVALKRIAPTLRSDERSRKRLWKEARCASGLQDANIAAIYDVLEEGSELFLVMEYVEGETLRQWMTRPFAIPAFLRIAQQCALGIAAAHQAGVLHHDIKPENIMLTASEQVKILDFGVARMAAAGTDGTTRSTLAGREFAGTPAYTAPEALTEGTLDARSDIFSLGVVFYEALARRHPFRAEAFLGTCERILHENPAPLNQLNTQVPAELGRIIAKMLAKEPGQRYSCAGDLAVDLNALQQAQKPGRPSSSADAAVGRRPGLRAAMIAFTAAMAILAAPAYRHLRTPVLSQHASILVTDFDNQSGEKLFDGTVTEAMRQALQQSQYVRVVPREQVTEALERMGRSAASPVDAKLGRELCQRENYRAMLTGRIVPTGGGYVITAQVEDPVQAAAAPMESVSLRSPRELYVTVDGLSRRLRQHAGESLAQIGGNSAPLARATTPSLEALQRYSRALDFYAAGDYQRFLPLAKSAVELDPHFAMAQWYLARAYDWLGDQAVSRQYLRQAQEGMDRVTERERYLIRASVYENEELFEKAAEQYRLLAELYPDDLEAYQGLAGVAVWTGRPEDAVTAERHAIQLNPRSAIDRHRLILFLDRLNRFDEALSEYKVAIDLGLKDPQLHRGAGLAQLGRGDVQAAHREFDLLRHEGGPIEESLADLSIARLFMYEGRLRDAADLLRTGLVQDEKLHSKTWFSLRRYLLARVLAREGKIAEAQKQCHEIAQAAILSREPEDLRRAGLLAIDLGNVNTARQLLKQIEELRMSSDDAFGQSCYYNLKGAVELAQGRSDAAVESECQSSAFFDSPEAAAELARIYMAQHFYDRAVQVYRDYLGLRGEIFSDGSPDEWVLANFWMAQASAKSGALGQGLRFYDEFLRLWSGADKDLPVLVRARSERSVLETTQRRGKQDSQPTHVP